MRRSSWTAAYAVAWTWQKLALGANAVAIGRPVWWVLTLGGAGVVAGVIDYFNRELVNTMLAGIPLEEIQLRTSETWWITAVREECRRLEIRWASP
jgi:hypothetical protein